VNSDIVWAISRCRSSRAFIFRSRGSLKRHSCASLHVHSAYGLPAMVWRCSFSGPFGWSLPSRLFGSPCPSADSESEDSTSGL